jgi:flagellar hook-associated protein 1 FlgK
LISQVNTVHSGGYSLTGSTGADFFTGTGAADIAVNANLAVDPRLIQAAGTPNAPGDNSVALALAQLKEQANGSLNGQTFVEYYSSVVGGFGQALSGANTQVSNHETVSSALLKQRDSISGVSIDEEMTNLITYQKAYQASAKIVTTVDEMLDTIIGMKR